MKSIADILEKFNPKEDKYVSREFQTFGVYLAEKLGDEKKKPLYIKYAKYFPRPVLEAALRFVIDSKARNKAALFMWKLRELGVFEKYKIPGPAKSTRKRIAEAEKAANVSESTPLQGEPEQKIPKKRGRKRKDPTEPFF